MKKTWCALFLCVASTAVSAMGRGYESEGASYRFHLEEPSNGAAVVRRLVYGNEDLASYAAETLAALGGGEAVYDRRVAVTAAAGDYVLLEDREYVYYDRAAHGNTTVSYLVIDLAGERVLDQGDFFTRDLSEALEAGLRERYGLAPGTPLTEAGFFEDAPVWPADAVSFTPGGVVFLWNAYTLAPYVMGQITLTLPAAAAPGLTAKARDILRALEEQ